MLRQPELETLAARTLHVLADIGVRIESDELADIATAKGCTEAPDGRIRIPEGLVDELVKFQKPTQAQDDEDQELLRRFGPDYAHHLIWSGQRDSIREEAAQNLLMAAFDCGPTKYYDYPSNATKAVDAAIFEDMMKFAQATPEVGYTSTWYRQDLPPHIERIHALVNGLRFTDKLDGIEAIYPEVIKYLIEAGEIYYELPKCSWFLAGSECFTSPLILERRSAEDMLERARLRLRRYHIGTMPTIGVNAPVTPAAAIVLSCAEVLGGMAIAFLLEPDADISGRAISTAFDMMTAATTSLPPETHIVNIGTKEVFDAFWGGHLWVEVHFSPAAKQPGLEAVLEYALGSARYARLSGTDDALYCGMGTLDNGGVGSPTQFMLDLEMRRMLHFTDRGCEVNDETLGFDEFCRHVGEQKEFLTSDHTLAHFREMYSSPLFGTTFSGLLGAGHGSEKEILDKADQMWRDNLSCWEPPDVPADKMRALEGLLERARRDFDIS